MKTQAWGWLAAGVVALGLNGFYHDGGLAWAHRVASQVKDSSAIVWALATVKADQVVAEAPLLTAREETASCRIPTVLARISTRVARLGNEVTHGQVAQGEINVARARKFSSEQEAAFARLEAQRARMEAVQARIEARMEARSSRDEARAGRLAVPAGVFIPVSAKVPVDCPRLRLNVPRVPVVRVPMIRVPAIRMNPSNAGPV